MLNVASPLIAVASRPGYGRDGSSTPVPPGPSGELRVAEDEAHVWAVQLDREASVIREMATLLDDTTSGIAPRVFDGAWIATGSLSHMPS